jgi:hypothetical protein
MGLGTDVTLGFNSTTTILVRDVGPKVFYVDPSASPFTLLSEKAGSKVATNPRFEWYEKALRPKLTNLSSSVNNTTTTIPVATNTGLYGQVNDLALNPSTGEIMRITAVAASDWTVVRGVAGTTGATSTSTNDSLFIIGSAYPEGANVQNPDEWQSVQVSNFTQIFRRPFGATRTREGSESYFGGNRETQRAEKAIEHAIDIERAFLFGEGYEDTSAAGAPRRTTRGFVNFDTGFGNGSMQVKDAGGTLTEAELETWLQDVFSKTSANDSRTLFAAPGVISVLDQLAAARLQTVPSDKTYGIAVKQWLTSHGTLNIIKHRLLENGPGGGQGWGSWALAVDVSKLMYRPFSNGSTKLLIDRQGNGTDGWIDEYLTESGLQVVTPEVHGILKNVTA